MKRRKHVNPVTKTPTETEPPRRAEELEPPTLVPGRRCAIAADLASVLDDFEAHLPHGASAAAGSDAPAFPKAGSYPMIKELFRKKGMSSMLERTNTEIARDLFQFIAGICWEMLAATAKLERRVGIVFLVYLLYHVQHPEQHAVPVDVCALEALAELREECERRQIFLECPQVLHKLATEGALSVGVRGTNRNLFFDRWGFITERLSFPEEDLNDPRVGAIVPEGVPAQRLQIETPGSSEQPDLGASAVLAQDGRSVINFEEVHRSAQEYDSESGHLRPLAPQLVHIASSANLYASQTPPEPRELVMRDSEGGPMIAEGPLQEESVRPRVKRKWSRLKVNFKDTSSSGTDSGDSLLEAVGDWPQRTLQNPLAGRCVKLHSKGSRHSQLIGLKKAMQRQRLAGARLQGDAVDAVSNRVAAMDDSAATSPGATHEGLSHAVDNERGVALEEGGAASCISGTSGGTSADVCRAPSRRSASPPEATRTSNLRSSQDPSPLPLQQEVQPQVLQQLPASTKGSDVSGLERAAELSDEALGDYSPTEGATAIGQETPVPSCEDSDGSESQHEAPWADTESQMQGHRLQLPEGHQPGSMPASSSTRALQGEADQAEEEDEEEEEDKEMEEVGLLTDHSPSGVGRADTTAGAGCTGDSTGASDDVSMEDVDM